MTNDTPRTHEIVDKLVGEATNSNDVERKKKSLTPEAQRALAEAEERRKKQDANQEQKQKEIGGRDGAEPVRYGDWEKGGIAWDF